MIERKKNLTPKELALESLYDKLRLYKVTQNDIIEAIDFALKAQAKEIFDELEKEVHKEKKRLFKIADKYEKKNNLKDARMYNMAGMTLGINTIRIINTVRIINKSKNKFGVDE